MNSSNLKELKMHNRPQLTGRGPGLDDGYEENEDPNVRPKKRRKKSKRKLKSTCLKVNTVLCECICNRKDQIGRELSEFEEEHSKLVWKKHKYTKGIRKAKRNDNYKKRMSLLRKREKDQYVMKSLETHMRHVQIKKESIDRLLRLLGHNRLSKKEVFRILDNNCRMHYIFRQKLNQSKDKFRQTEEEFKQLEKTKLFKKRAMDFIILRKEFSSLSFYLLKNVTSRFKIKENRKPRLKKDHINWIVQKIERIRTFNGRKYYEENPQKIEGKVFYPTDINFSKIPGPISRIIFQYLQKCRKVLDNVGLANPWFHTILLLTWGHLDLSTSNSWKIPDIVWLSITSVKIKYYNFLKEQRYVFGKLRKSKNLIAMSNLDHHRSLHEYSFPSVKICEFYTVASYFNNFNFNDHLHQVFPDIETLHLTVDSPFFTKDFFKTLEKLNYITIKEWTNMETPETAVKEARLLRELNQTGRCKIDIYKVSSYLSKELVSILKPMIFVEKKKKRWMTHTPFIFITNK